MVEEVVRNAMYGISNALQIADYSERLEGTYMIPH